MPKQKPDLSQALKSLDNRAPAAPKAEAPSRPAKREADPHYRPGRDGMENLTGYFPPGVKDQLLMLAIRRKRETGARVTLQDLQAEALNDLFAKYGLPEIAPVGRKEGQG